MNELLAKLQGGDLRSDGLADAASDVVLKDSSLLDMLMEGLSVEDDVVRARAAHALEKVSRKRRDLLRGDLRLLARIALEDDVAMVRWHMAMILGHLAEDEADAEIALPPLFALLDDRSIFVESWAIVSLTIIGAEHQRYRELITARIAKYSNHQSVAIRSKVSKSLDVLMRGASLPSAWRKAERSGQDTGSNVLG